MRQKNNERNKNKNSKFKINHKKTLLEKIYNFIKKVISSAKLNIFLVIGKKKDIQRKKTRQNLSIVINGVELKGANNL